MHKEESIEAIAEMERKVFQYDTLVAATKKFSEKLGEGGFGPVFKANCKILTNLFASHFFICEFSMHIGFLHVQRRQSLSIPL